MPAFDVNPVGDTPAQVTGLTNGSIYIAVNNGDCIVWIREEASGMTPAVSDNGIRLLQGDSTPLLPTGGQVYWCWSQDGSGSLYVYSV